MLLLQLVVLFVVLFDPPASMSVFYVATRAMKQKERRRTALLAVGVATIISIATFLLGDLLLSLFHTDIGDFRIAGGIILIILGVKMSLGYPLVYIDTKKKEKSVQAIASLIATPLLTGPAVISSIILLKNDYGLYLPALAAGIVLAGTYVILVNTAKLYQKLGSQIPQLTSTFLGLITIAWGIGFLRTALGF
jgi:multiple antibiotic resistance protein